MRTTLAALILAAGTLGAQETARVPHDQDATWWLELTGPAAGAPQSGVLIRADGGASRLAVNGSPPPDPGLSPDRSRRVEVVRDRGRERDLAVRPTRAGERDAVRLTRDHDDLDPVWSKDGASILFRSDRGGDGWQLWRIAADGGAPERLTEGAASVRDAHLSPDGSAVLLVRRTERPPARRQGMREWDLDVSILDLGTRSVRTLLADLFTVDVAWSPDGARIACGAETEVLVLDAASGEAVRRFEPRAIDERLYSHGAHAFLWRPDGAAFACKLSFLGQTMAIDGEVSKMFGDDELFVLHLDGGVATLAAPPEPDVRAAWTGWPLAWRRLPR